MSSLRLPALPASWRDRRDLYPRNTTLGAVLFGARIGFLLLWAYSLYRVWDRDGVPFDAQGLLLWIGLGLLAYSVGKHPVWLLWVVLDIVPFAAALLAYDRLRGFAYKLGMPGWWHPQIDIDKILGFGHVPTVWLQEHIKYKDTQWWDVLVTITYSSYFLVPYVVAGVLWLRGRTEFYRWTLRYVGLSFFCYALFVLIPSAPPWAAARCTSFQVIGHPTNPSCMYYGAQYTTGGGLLGPFTTHQPGANAWVEQTVWRGWSYLHLDAAASLIRKGHEYFDPVAAIPSLHVGATTMLVIYFWKRTPKWLKPLLAAYPFVMTFSLVYSGEHYVTDAIAGAGAAFLIHYLAGRIERSWGQRKEGDDSVDILDESDPRQPLMEYPCPPTSQPPQPQLPATTPSST
jgi:membrane-associated phospholipid phosphatase